MNLERFTTEQRVQAPYHHIDPGLINHRLVLSTFGTRFCDVFNRHRRAGNDLLSELQNDHFLVDMALRTCCATSVPSLGALLQDPQPGILFCSTERIRGDSSVYQSDHARVEILVPYEITRRVFLEFHTKHIVSDTGTRSSRTTFGSSSDRWKSQSLNRKTGWQSCGRCPKQT